MYLHSVQVHSGRKKKRIDSSVVSCKICKGLPFSKPVQRLPLMSLDGVEDFEIPVEVLERARISLTSSIFAYPGSRKIFGETGAYMDRTCCQPHIREPRCTIAIGDDWRRYARARKPGALPSFPALTCRPFFFVPPAYRIRFFKATHVLSMCDMPLKRHEVEGDTRVRCMRVSMGSADAIY